MGSDLADMSEAWTLSTQNILAFCKGSLLAGQQYWCTKYTAGQPVELWMMAGNGKWTRGMKLYMKVD